MKHFSNERMKELKNERMSKKILTDFFKKICKTKEILRCKTSSFIFSFFHFLIFSFQNASYFKTYSLTLPRAKNPITNRTIRLRIPFLVCPVACVITATKKGPIIAANFPKIL